MALSLLYPHDYAKPRVVGDRKVAEVQITWTSSGDTYAAGGMDISAEILALTGISFITNFIPIYAGFGDDNSNGGPTGTHANRAIHAFWNIANQKLQFLKDGQALSSDTRTEIDNGVVIGQAAGQLVFIVARIEGLGSS